MATHPPKKNKFMPITTRPKRQNLRLKLPPIHINNQTIDEVNDHKVLGVTVDNNLSWSEHVSVPSKNISRKVYQLSKFKHYFDLHSRNLFYLAYIQSSIDYASTIWGSASASTIKPLLTAYTNEHSNLFQTKPSL
jgi:hypothetical protein